MVCFDARTQEASKGGMSDTHNKNASFIVKGGTNAPRASPDRKTATVTVTVTKQDGHRVHVVNRETLQRAIKTAMKEYA